MSAHNVLGWEIVLKISHLPSKLRFSAKCSFFRAISQSRTLSPDIPAAWRGLFTKYFGRYGLPSSGWENIAAPWRGKAVPSEILGNIFLYRVISRANFRSVQKPVDANSGLKVNQRVDFSCIKMFFTVFGLCILRLSKPKTKEQAIKVAKLKSKFSLTLG